MVCFIPIEDIWKPFLGLKNLHVYYIINTNSYDYIHVVQKRKKTATAF